MLWSDTFDSLVPAISSQHCKDDIRFTGRSYYHHSTNPTSVWAFRNLEKKKKRKKTTTCKSKPSLQKDYRIRLISCHKAYSAMTSFSPVGKYSFYILPVDASKSVLMLGESLHLVKSAWHHYVQQLSWVNFAYFDRLNYAHMESLVLPSVDPGDCNLDRASNDPTGRTRGACMRLVEQELRCYSTNDGCLWLVVWLKYYSWSSS